jgi:hypothetical protein
LSEQKNKTARPGKARALERTVAAFVATLSIAACATSPPVQEMSDARQAIAAAEEASAAALAPDPLNDARRFLETAEQQLRQEAYGAARINAVRAKNRAVQALEASLEAADESAEED